MILVINSEVEGKTKLKELDNLILRNLSLITHLYLYACGKEEIKTMDFGMSSMGASLIESKVNKITRKNTKINNESSNVIMKPSDSQTLQVEKKNEIIDHDNVYNNDLYFCLDFNHFWKLIRECGLITSDISLAMLDRISFQNPDNNIEMFYLPDILTNKGNKNSTEEEKEIIYDYLYKKIEKAKIDFENKYRKKIKQSQILIYGENKNEKEINKENEKNTEQKKRIS